VLLLELSPLFFREIRVRDSKCAVARLGVGHAAGVEVLLVEFDNAAVFLELSGDLELFGGSLDEKAVTTSIFPDTGSHVFLLGVERRAVLDVISEFGLLLHDAHLVRVLEVLDHSLFSWVSVDLEFLVGVHNFLG